MDTENEIDPYGYINESVVKMSEESIHYGVVKSFEYQNRESGLAVRKPWLFRIKYDNGDEEVIGTDELREALDLHKDIEAKVSPKDDVDPQSFVGNRVAKVWGDRLHFGTVKSYSDMTLKSEKKKKGRWLFRIEYDGGEEEDINIGDLRKALTFFSDASEPNANVDAKGERHEAAKETPLGSITTDKRYTTIEGVAQRRPQKTQEKTFDARDFIHEKVAKLVGTKPCSGIVKATWKHDHGISKDMGDILKFEILYDDGEQEIVGLETMQAARKIYADHVEVLRSQQRENATPKTGNRRTKTLNLEEVLNRRVLKRFGGRLYFGTVRWVRDLTSGNDRWWFDVRYDDGDSEDLNKKELDEAFKLHEEIVYKGEMPPLQNTHAKLIKTEEGRKWLGYLERAEQIHRTLGMETNESDILDWYAIAKERWRLDLLIPEQKELLRKIGIDYDTVTAHGSEQGLFLIDRVEKCRISSSSVAEFLVSWKGYLEKTWVKRSDMTPSAKEDAEVLLQRKRKEISEAKSASKASKCQPPPRKKVTTSSRMNEKNAVDRSTARVEPSDTQSTGASTATSEESEEVHYEPVRSLTQDMETAANWNVIASKGGAHNIQLLKTFPFSSLEKKLEKYQNA